RRAFGQGLDRVIAEVLVKPRPPRRGHAVSRLQDRAQPPRPPAPDEAEMAAVAARHQLDDEAGLAVPPRPDDDAFVRPVHGPIVSRIRPGNRANPWGIRSPFPGSAPGRRPSSRARARTGKGGPAARAARTV